MQMSNALGFYTAGGLAMTCKRRFMRLFKA